MTFPVLSIPNATDVPSQSQQQLKNNFDSIIGWAAVDHVGFGTTKAGDHNQVTFAGVTSQSVPTNPTSVLYTKNDAFSVPQLFFLNSQNTSQNYVNGGYSGQGSTILFGGVIIKWGFVDHSAAPVVYTQPFPNNTLNVTATAYANGSQVNITGGASKTGFTFANNTTFFWMAIGN